MSLKLLPRKIFRVNQKTTGYGSEQRAKCRASEIEKLGNHQRSFDGFSCAPKPAVSAGSLPCGFCNTPALECQQGRRQCAVAYFGSERPLASSARINSRLVLNRLPQAGMSPVVIATPLTERLPTTPHAIIGTNRRSAVSTCRHSSIATVQPYNAVACSVFDLAVGIHRSCRLQAAQFDADLGFVVVHSSPQAKSQECHQATGSLWLLARIALPAQPLNPAPGAVGVRQLATGGSILCCGFSYCVQPLLGFFGRSLGFMV